MSAIRVLQSICGSNGLRIKRILLFVVFAFIGSRIFLLEYN